MKNQKEVWLPVKGYERLYEVSNLGRVISLPKIATSYSYQYIKGEKLLKNNVLPSGYKVVSLYKNKKSKNFLIHRLVAIAFLTNPQQKKCVNHINSNRGDNYLDNLEWVTHKENSKHSMLLDRQVKGEKVGVSKTTEKNVISIRKIYNNGCVTTKQLGFIFNLHQTTISDIINRKTWRHV